MIMEALPPEAHKLSTSFWERLATLYPLETVIRIAQAMILPSRQPTIRINTLKIRVDEALGELAKEGIVVEGFSFSPVAFLVVNANEERLARTKLYQEGKIYLQQIASQIPPLVMDLKPGLRVLDAAAAPGSKTSQIAALMEGKGEIVANEKDPIRLKRLIHNLTLLGCTNVLVRQGDALDLGESFAPESFDRILADLPCSAEGRINLRRERSYGYWHEELPSKHYKHQRSIMRRLVPLLKPGGIMVYSTCTIAPEENEAIVHFLLCNYPELELVALTPMASFMQPAVHRFGSVAYRRETVGALRGLPSPESEGFFIAKFKKRG